MMSIIVVSELFTDAIGEPNILDPVVFTTLEKALAYFQKRIKDAQGDENSYWETDRGFRWDDYHDDNDVFINRTAIELTTVEIQ